MPLDTHKKFYNYCDTTKDDIEAFRAKTREYIETKLGKVTDAQFEAIFRYAWEEGHASGYAEICLCVEDLLVILECWVKKG